MRICLIAEGSYPYVAGGVSTWINGLVREMPDKTFSVLSIMPDKESAQEYKYEIPDNLVEIQTIYMNGYKSLRPAKMKKEPFLGRKESIELQRFFSFDKGIDWKTISRVFGRVDKAGDAVQLLQSEMFWKILVDRYNEDFKDENFNKFFWTFRSMLLPTVYLLQQNVAKADIYHAVSTGYAGLMGILLKYKYKKPLILTEHGIYAREREEEIIRAPWVTGAYKKLWIEFFYFISVGAYKTSDEVISLFERNRRIQLDLGSDIRSTRVIPNSVDLEKFNLQRESHGGHIVGAVLRLVPIKDVKTLIRAFKIISGKMENVKLFLIGPTDEDKSYYGECLRLVDSLGLNDKVVFTGKVDVKKYMPMFDVMVLTSISEGQPLVMLEAMAASIPFVSTNVGSCAELIDGLDDGIGPAGFVTRLVNPNETAQSIMKILRDDSLRDEMGSNGRKRVEAFYRKETFIESYRKIYEAWSD